MSATESSVARPAGIFPPLFADPVRATFAVLAAYFALRIVARTLISDTPELDEAEQLIQTQVWLWGYGPQPPLYTWVQKLFCAVFGTNIFALALLKNLLLSGTCAMTYLAGREIAGDRRAGVAAAWSLFFVPQFAWASQNDLTHSVLAMLLVAATFLLIVKLMRERTTARYVCLGLVAAAGVLSKYNYIALLAVCVPALLSLAGGRQVLADKRFVLTLAVLLALLAPHLHWMWLHQELALRKLPELHATEKNLVQNWLQGFVTLGQALLMYVVPLWAAWLVILRRMPGRAEFWPPDSDRATVLLKRTLVFSLVFYALAIFVVQAKFKERWIQPNLYALPLLVVAGVGSKLTDARVKRCGMLAAVVACLVFLVLAGRVVFAGVTGLPARQNLPWRELAEQLKQTGLQPAVIIAENAPLGAAFEMAFPGAGVVVPRQATPPIRDGARLIVWEHDDKSRFPDGPVEFAAQHGIPPDAFAAARVVEAPLKYAPNRRVKLAYIYVRAPQSSGP